MVIAPVAAGGAAAAVADMMHALGGPAALADILRGLLPAGLPVASALAPPTTPPVAPPSAHPRTPTRRGRAAVPAAAPAVPPVGAGLWAAAAAIGDDAADGIAEMANRRAALKREREQIGNRMRLDERKRQRRLDVASTLSNGDLAFVMGNRAEAKAKAEARASARMEKAAAKAAAEANGGAAPSAPGDVAP